VASGRLDDAEGSLLASVSVGKLGLLEEDGRVGLGEGMSVDRAAEDVEGRLWRGERRTSDAFRGVVSASASVGGRKGVAEVEATGEEVSEMAPGSLEGRSVPPGGVNGREGGRGMLES
jgi:hypothetical protein